MLVKTLIEQLDQRFMEQAEKRSTESVAHAKELAGLDLRITDLVASGRFNSLEMSTSANVLGVELAQQLVEQVDRSIAAVTLSERTTSENAEKLAKNLDELIGHRMAELSSTRPRKQSRPRCS
jgi:hypothetical protein